MLLSLLFVFVARAGDICCHCCQLRWKLLLSLGFAVIVIPVVAVIVAWGVVAVIVARSGSGCCHCHSGKGRLLSLSLLAAVAVFVVGYMGVLLSLLVVSDILALGSFCHCCSVGCCHCRLGGEAVADVVTWVLVVAVVVTMLRAVAVVINQPFQYKINSPIEVLFLLVFLLDPLSCWSPLLLFGVISG